MKITYDEKTKRIKFDGLDRVGYEKNMNNDLKVNEKIELDKLDT